MCVDKEAAQDRDAVSLKLKASSSCVSTVHATGMHAHTHMYGHTSPKENPLHSWSDIKETLFAAVSTSVETVSRG